MLSNGQHKECGFHFVTDSERLHEDKYKKHVMWLRSNEGQLCTAVLMQPYSEPSDLTGFDWPPFEMTLAATTYYDW